MGESLVNEVNLGVYNDIMLQIPVALESLDYAKPVSHYAQEWGMSRTTAKRLLQEAGIYNRFIFVSGENTATLRRRMLKAEYDLAPKKCKGCEKSILYDKKENDYCSLSCSQTNYAKNHQEEMVLRGQITKQRIKDGTWKKPNPPKSVKGVPMKPRKIVPCAHCQNPMSLPPSSQHKKYCSRVCAAKNPVLGGYREKAGAPCSGWYKGIYCNSSWELAWVIYQLEHEVGFKRCEERFSYQFNGKTHHYHPDFVLEDCHYIEIKGRPSAKWEAKISQFPHPIKVLYFRDLKPIFQYVVSRYGSDYIRLYDGNPHKTRKNQCPECGQPARKKYCSKTCSGRAVAKLRGWDKTLWPSGEPPISTTSQVVVSGGAPD